MKTPAQVRTDIDRRLSRSWADDVVERVGGPASEDLWPYDFPLGRAKSTELAQRFTEITVQVAEWRAWARLHRVELLEEDRRVSGTEQTLPAHVRIPDIDTAATVVGEGWPDKLQRARKRAGILVSRYPDLSRPARMLAATDSYGDTDFGLLMDAADWFADSTIEQRAALTPRQVPVRGLHAKWLNTHRNLVAELAGLMDLGLLPPHPARIHFTYLDPDYLATGARRHDSGSVGDAVELPYQPQVVLISENKDTAVGFPPVPGGVAVEGAGRGGVTHAAFEWIRAAPFIAYWGDMDADGLEILNEFRVVGIGATSLLMDLTAYEAWERFGTNSDPHGRSLGPRVPRSVDQLTLGEGQLYLALTSPEWARFRRIEQERIPLAIAHAALSALTA